MDLLKEVKKKNFANQQKIALTKIVVKRLCKKHSLSRQKLTPKRYLFSKVIFSFEAKEKLTLVGISPPLQNLIGNMFLFVGVF